MRTKTDTRRAAIIDTAIEVFREAGYERTSMSMISARVGGSKGTLYNYFSSKEALFSAAMIQAMEGQGQAAFELLDVESGNEAQVLASFGNAYLNMLITSDAVATTRIAIAHGKNTSLGPDLYNHAIKRGWSQMCDYIRKLQKSERLKQGDAWLMALQLKGLLEAGFLEPLLFGTEIEFSQSHLVDEAVTCFLLCHRKPLTPE